MVRTVKERIAGLQRVGEKIENILDGNVPEFDQVMSSSRNLNGWFTPDNIELSLKGIQLMLNPESLTEMAGKYQLEKGQGKNIGIIMAGNIPAAGFHDMLCVVLSGNIALCKFSSDDSVYMRYLAALVEAELPGSVMTVNGKLSGIDAVIATGSNNTARYFEYYFSKYPHIIRKNRNSVAVLSGDETAEELKNLGFDIFSFFGLGCRNISKLYVPEGYGFNKFFESIVSYSDVINNNKYANNYDYNRAMLLMKQVPFLDNNFLMIREESILSSPISMLHYEFYSDKADLILDLHSRREEIQCFAANKEAFSGLDGIRPVVPLGRVQFPELSDYADGVDTLKFLQGIE